MFNVLKMLLNSNGMGIHRQTLSDFLSTYKKCYLLSVDSLEVQFRVVNFSLSIIVKTCSVVIEKLFFDKTETL